jgi:rhodanese-related sulfurtransferase
VIVRNSAPSLLLLGLLLSVTALAGCSSDNDGAGGVRTVDPVKAQAVIEDAREDVVVLDVRTPEEFAEGHLTDAVMVDFYESDFAEQIAQLDPDATSVLYCRSGNRSGTTAAIMDELGFSDVVEVDGGILAWNAAGLPLQR